MKKKESGKQDFTTGETAAPAANETAVADADQNNEWLDYSEDDLQNSSFDEANAASSTEDDAETKGGSGADVNDDYTVDSFASEAGVAEFEPYEMMSDDDAQPLEPHKPDSLAVDGSSAADSAVADVEEHFFNSGREATAGAEPDESSAGAEQKVRTASMPDYSKTATGAGSDIEPSTIDFFPPLLHCLAMLFKLHGSPVSVNIIASSLPSGQASHRPTVLLRAAKTLGLESSIVAKTSIAHISKLTLPCILMLQHEGACVLLEMDETHATVMFPEQGNAQVRVDRAELEREFIGYAIFAKLESKLDDRASKIKLLNAKRWFWGTLLDFMPIYKHVFSASIIVNLLTLVSPLFFMNVYDKVVPNGENALDTLWALALGIFIAYIFDFILKNLRSYFVDVAGRNADVVMASRLMRQLLSLRLDAKPDSTGSLANNLREFESLRDFFGSSTLTTLIDLPFLVIFLVIIWFIGSYLVIVPLIAIPIVFVIGLLMQLPLQQVTEKGFKENMQKNAILVEIINGLETIKTSMAEGRMQTMWEKIVGLSAISSAHSKSMVTMSLNLTVLLTQLVSVGTIILGVYLINDKAISMGALIACNMLGGRAMAPLSQIAGMCSRLQQSRMALKALDQLMQLPTENVANGSYVEFGHLEHSLRVEELSFKYPNSERLALENVNLSVNAGEKVGIIGSMGSGKSTMGRLCVGLYQPAEGAVKMGGVDIRQLDITTLRSRFGYVSQDNYLFYGTLRENISFGAINIDDRMILRAANIAGVADFVRNHPAGFGMQVGERGMNLSGGQRQSVAIARALLRDPDILILDEPSSNMDNYSENMLKQRLASIMGNKTLLLITHRLSMLDLVDRVIVMNNGRIYADGPKEKVLTFLKQEQMKATQARKTALEELRKQKQPA